MGKKNKYYQPQKDKHYVAGQNIFHYDDDEYNEDGTLKKDIFDDDFSGSFYDDDGGTNSERAQVLQSIQLICG